MHIVAIAWLFVVILMAVAEAISPQGSVLGAIFTFLVDGILPLVIVMYLLATPARRRAARRFQASTEAERRSTADPHRSDHAPADAVAAEREKP
jgi:hypothetical protein